MCYAQRAAQRKVQIRQRAWSAPEAQCPKMHRAKYAQHSTCQPQVMTEGSWTGDLKQWETSVVAGLRSGEQGLRGQPI